MTPTRDAPGSREKGGDVPWFLFSSLPLVTPLGHSSQEARRQGALGKVVPRAEQRKGLERV